MPYFLLLAGLSFRALKKRNERKINKLVDGTVTSVPTTVLGSIMPEVGVKIEK